jgi:hypothetical protein
MSDKRRPPRLALLPGDKVGDVDAMARMYEALTGKKVDEAGRKRMLEAYEAAKAETAAAKAKAGRGKKPDGK